METFKKYSDVMYLISRFEFFVLPLSNLSADDLLIQIVPEHLELRHWLLYGAAIGLLFHLLQQEARLVVQPLHLNLQLVRFSFELLTKPAIQCYTQSVNGSTKSYRQYQLCLFSTRFVSPHIKANVTTMKLLLQSHRVCKKTDQLGYDMNQALSINTAGK